MHKESWLRQYLKQEFSKRISNDTDYQDSQEIWRELNLFCCFHVSCMQWLITRTSLADVASGTLAACPGGLRLARRDARCVYVRLTQPSLRTWTVGGRSFCPGWHHYCTPTEAPSSWCRCIWHCTMVTGFNAREICTIPWLIHWIKVILLVKQQAWYMCSMVWGIYWFKEWCQLPKQWQNSTIKATLIWQCVTVVESVLYCRIWLSGLFPVVCGINGVRQFISSNSWNLSVYFANCHC